MKPVKRKTDPPVDPARSAQMALVRSKDTQPEMRVRRSLHAAGLRYRLQDKRLPGRPDIVFASRRAVVLVHGCFWHRHPDPACRLARMPKTRQDFWIPKLEGNAERDRGNLAALEEMGWRTFVIWECETKDPARLAALAEEVRGLPVVGPPPRRRPSPARVRPLRRRA